tara:strand:- start:256 stop:501 length:246 start_codon:yes stop_codon:yes gene_type:complete
MEVTTDIIDGNAVVTIPPGFYNSTDEDLEIIIRVTVEPEKEPEYPLSVIDVAATSVANSYTLLIKVFTGLFLVGLFLSVFQ